MSGNECRRESPHTAHARSASDGSSRSAQSKTWSDGSSALGYDGTLTWLRCPSGFTCDSACGSRARVLERVGWRSWRGRDPWHRGRGPRLHHAPRTTAQEDVVEAAHEGLRLVLGAREVCEVGFGALLKGWGGREREVGGGCWGKSVLEERQEGAIRGGEMGECGHSSAPCPRARTPTAAALSATATTGRSSWVAARAGGPRGGSRRGAAGRATSPAGC